MARDIDATLEDLEFLDETGTGAIEAAERTHFRSAQALYQWLAIEHGHKDLWKRLRARDPIGSDLARPITPSPTQPQEATMTDPTGTLIQRALECPTARIRRKGEKVRDLVDELRGALDEDEQRRDSEREAREEIERLERELADARARLRKPSTSDRGGSSTARAPRQMPKGDFPCPGCGKHFDTAQGRALHQTAHCSASAERVPA